METLVGTGQTFSGWELLVTFLREIGTQLMESMQNGWCLDFHFLFHFGGEFRGVFNFIFSTLQSCCICQNQRTLLVS